MKRKVDICKECEHFLETERRPSKMMCLYSVDKKDVLQAWLKVVFSTHESLMTKWEFEKKEVPENICPYFVEYTMEEWNRK